MDEIITVQNRADLSQFTGGLDVISVMPQDPVPSEWDWDTGHLYKYKVNIEKIFAPTFKSVREKSNHCLHLYLFSDCYGV